MICTSVGSTISEIDHKEVIRGTLYRKGAVTLESYIAQMLELSEGCHGVTTGAKERAGVGLEATSLT